jgi:hypothetical protein
MLRDTLDLMPLPMVLVITTAIVLSAIEVGYRIGVWRKTTSTFDSEAQLSAMTGANLGLLAFILAFSFSQAGNHHSNRKQLIMEEANAISTAHLRAGLVNKTEGEKIRELLVQYLDIRASIAPSRDFDPTRMIAESVELQAEIWAQVQQISEYDNVNELDALLVETINAIFDIHEKRVAAGVRNRLPASIWYGLLVLVSLSMLGIGHFSGMKGKRNPISSTALALSFSTVVFLIADLDRPTSGLVQADQWAILQLQERLSK